MEDTQSDVIISVFLSLNCSACGSLFNSILRLIDHNLKMKVQFIFSNEIDKITNRLLKIIIGYFQSGQNEKAIEVLRLWYNNIDKTARSEFIKNYNLLDNQADIKDTINANNTLFRMAKVTKVPSVYVNSYPLPDIYSIDDIKYHLIGLNKMGNKLKNA